jgi:hypothetical protein
MLLANGTSSVSLLSELKSLSDTSQLCHYIATIKILAAVRLEFIFCCVLG